MKKKIISRRFLFILAAIMLIVAVAAPVLASPATATRTLPSSVSSGAEFEVAIETSGCGAFGQLVETLPDGFTYLSCSSGNIGVEQLGNTLKFTFLGDSASFTYRVKAPTVEVTTTYTFHGVVNDEDRISYPVEDDEVTVCRKGDFDGDGDVDVFDFAYFADAYDSKLGDPNYNAVGDFDNDGDVDVFNFAYFADVYGT